MENTKVAVFGATGYTGSELLRILLRHPHAEVVHVTAHSNVGKVLADVLPHMRGRLDLTLMPADAESVPDDVGLAFLALPHGSSAPVARELLEKGIRVVDLGADFRLSRELYEQWYVPHPCPELLGEAVYGLSELFKPSIRRARLVANPGCYPTSAVLALAPLVANGILADGNVVVDSKSGVSGAGRTQSLAYHFCEVNEGVRAYKVGEHRHTPEIAYALKSRFGRCVAVEFTPHLIPMTRGILSTVYVGLTESLGTEELLALYVEFYDGEPFVRIHPPGIYPSTAGVKGSNYADIGLRADPRTRRAVVVCAIDNLVKGASGQAVQNMNLMLDLDETTALDDAPLFP